MKKYDIKGVSEEYGKILNALEDLQNQCNAIRTEVREMNSALSSVLGVRIEGANSNDIECFSTGDGLYVKKRDTWYEI